MFDGEGGVTELGDAACWELLATTEFGRIAIAAGETVDILPVNFCVDSRRLVFRTAPGNKLSELSVRHRVAFEIDGFDDGSAWSVVVKGFARILDRQPDIDAADALGLQSWIPTLKYTYVRIEPTTLSGRRFERALEPERYW